MSELEKFLQERSKIPIPSGDVAWVKLLAKELALGVHRNLWHPGEMRLLHIRQNSKLYFERRWKNRDFTHLVKVLYAHEYLKSNKGFSSLSQKAYDLLEETEPYNVFISYKRSESSAFALLVLAKLKEHNLMPFVDMALEAGGNWHADLKDRIKSCDYFIILLGEDTLASDMTVKEIGWALEYERTIIPVWHSGFDLNDKKWAQVDGKVKDAIQQTNAIRVLDESAGGYNRAIVELLNRFGVTP